MTEGNTETLLCVVTNASPEGSISWFLDGVNITQTEAVNTIDHRMMYLIESTLELAPDGTQHGETIMCVVTQQIRDGIVSKNTSQILNVKCESKLKLSKGCKSIFTFL